MSDLKPNPLKSLQAAASGSDSASHDKLVHRSDDAHAGSSRTRYTPGDSADFEKFQKGAAEPFSISARGSPTLKATALFGQSGFDTAWSKANAPLTEAATTPPRSETIGIVNQQNQFLHAAGKKPDRSGMLPDDNVARSRTIADLKIELNELTSLLKERSGGFQNEIKIQRDFLLAARKEEPAVYNVFIKKLLDKIQESTDRQDRHVEIHSSIYHLLNDRDRTRIIVSDMKSEDFRTNVDSNALEYIPAAAILKLRAQDGDGQKRFTLIGNRAAAILRDKLGDVIFQEKILRPTLEYPSASNRRELLKGFLHQPEAFSSDQLATIIQEIRNVSSNEVSSWGRSDGGWPDSESFSANIAAGHINDGHLAQLMELACRDAAEEPANACVSFLHETLLPHIFKAPVSDDMRVTVLKKAMQSGCLSPLDEEAPDNYSTGGQKLQEGADREWHYRQISHLPYIDTNPAVVGKFTDLIAGMPHGEERATAALWLLNTVDDKKLESVQKDRLLEIVFQPGPHLIGNMLTLISGCKEVDIDIQKHALQCIGSSGKYAQTALTVLFDRYERSARSDKLVMSADWSNLMHEDQMQRVGLQKKFFDRTSLDPEVFKSIADTLGKKVDIKSMLPWARNMLPRAKL